MDYKVVYTPDARENYISIVDYLFYSLSNPQAANNFIREMDRIEDVLSLFAKNFAFCEDLELRLMSLHIIHLKRMNYFVLYRIKGKIVTIVAIFHSSQDYKNIFLSKF